MTDSSPLKGRHFLMFVDHIYEDLELWYPKLRLIEAGENVAAMDRRDMGNLRGPCGQHAGEALRENPMGVQEVVATTGESAPKGQPFAENKRRCLQKF